MDEPTGYYARLKLRWILWLASKLPSCEAITEMASRSLDEPLPRMDALRMRIHFTICVWCERYLHQLQYMRIRAREDIETRPAAHAGSRGLSEDARKRMRDAIRNARQDLD